MIIEVEVPDQKAMALLQQLEDLNVLKLKKSGDTQARLEDLKNEDAKKPMTNEERAAIIRSLRGAIPYDEKRYEEQLQFMHEVRNEWER